LVGIVLFLLFLNKQLVSAFMTTGIVVGVFIGNYLGKIIKGINEAKIIEGMKAEEVYRLHHNPGFEIWISIIFLFIIIGIIVQITYNRRTVK
ncbi:hypothetical protein P3687_25780, partial [Vibrio parahaemolyticus]|nr:hypothetical protein [Vibrio parahaemolyticus]